MINKEDKVCSLLLAKKLSDLGVPQISELYWRIEIDDGEEYPELWDCDFIERPGLKKYSAFTEEELIEIMPKNVAINRNIAEAKIKIDDTPVNARSKMFIYLLENNLVTL